MTPLTPSPWFQANIRYLWLWPFNLVRDFPARYGRLVRTTQAGIRCLEQLPAAGAAASRQRHMNRWLTTTICRLIRGAHLFLVQWFDLIGGPEIIQLLFHLFINTTPLTPDEIATMTAILGPKAMRYQDVRIATGGILTFIFKWNGNLAFTAWHTISLPPAPAHHTRANRGLLVHELLHVYQYENVGSRYMTEAIYVLIKTRRDCYQYGGITGLREAAHQQRRYAQFNREQQAQIVQDYYNRQLNGLDVATYQPYIQQLRDGQL